MKTNATTLGQRPLDTERADELAAELIKAIDDEPDKMYVDNLTTAAIVDTEHTVEELHQLGLEPYNHPDVEFYVMGAQHGVEAVIRARERMGGDCHVSTYPSRIFAIGGLDPTAK